MNHAIRPCRHRAMLFFAGASLLFFTACDPSGADSPAPDAPPEATSESQALAGSNAQFQQLEGPGLSGTVRLSPAVFSLSENMLPALSLDEGRVEVPAGAAAVLHGRRQGDILLFSGEGGFWRYIESVEQQGGQTVYKTRPAKLEEVIQDGTITLEVRPSFEVASGPADDATRTRSQGLGLGDLVDTPLSVTKTKSFNTSLPLDSTSEFQFVGNDVELSTRGTLDFRPGFKLVLEVGNFNIQKLEFTALGRLDLDAQATLKVNEGRAPTAIPTQVFYRDIPLCSSNPGNNIVCDRGNPTFVASLLGQSIKVFPSLRAGFAWSGTGSGQVTTGLRADGNIKAGYAFIKGGENQKIFENAVSARATDPDYEGSIDLDYKMSLELAMTVSLNGDPMIEAFPFEGIFSAEASTMAPSCGIGAALKVSGRVVRHGFMGSGSWPLYNSQPLDFHFPIDAPGCSTDTTQDAQTCSTANPNCAKGETCNQGYCVEDAPFQLSLNWTDASADLDLIIENPDGELLLPSGSGDAQPATHGWMAVKSCAGVCEGAPAAGYNFTEIGLFRLHLDGRQYRFWVKNNTPAPAGGAPDIAYTLQVVFEDEPVNVMYGKLPASTGAESLHYVFMN